MRNETHKASVGLSTQICDPEWTKSISNTFGEYQHQLTINELPKFSLDIDATTSDSSGSARPSFNFKTDAAANLKTSEIGGNAKHNIVQQSIIDTCWRRTS